MEKFKVWMAQIRANFLILSVFLVLLGLALSLKYPGPDEFSWFRAVLVLIGTILAHVSVNLFNEYSDYATKIDFSTSQTPFSGGSKMLISGKSDPKQVLIVALVTLSVAFGIGVYLSIISHWMILVFALIGSFSIVFYTNTLAKYMLGELFAGLALGTLVVLGTYIAMVAEPGMAWGRLVPVEAELLSIPPGILTALLLLINEFPDAEADRKGGRKHLVIRMGRQNAAWIYAAGVAATFLIILVLPVLNITSYWIYLGLIPLPLGLKASITAIKFNHNNAKLIPALGSNVMMVLGVDLLLAVGVFIDIM